MKRIIMSVIVMLSMTFAFAENENTDAMNRVQAYDMHVNMNKLGETLGLSSDQLQFVSDVHDAFCADMLNVALSDESERSSMMDKVVSDYLDNMRVVLTKSQYRKYLLILNNTFKNRGLK